MKRLLLGLLVAVIGSLVAQPAAGDAGAEFAMARDLYQGADYTGALLILNRLTVTGDTHEDVVSVQQYRALCYLALGETSEAQRALETIVTAAPFYRPANTDLSPRLQSTFTDVRRRVLPGIVRQTYATARAAYERREFETANASFRDVLRLLNDPDVAAPVDSSFADLQLVAAAFSELSLRAAAQPPVDEGVAASTIVNSPRMSGRNEIYTAATGDAVPPVPIAQALPAYAGAVKTSVRGTLEVTIDERGYVTEAKMRVPTNTAYDAVALAAARRWRYKPALVEGTPVKYLKIVYVNITPPQQAIAPTRHERVSR